MKKLSLLFAGVISPMLLLSPMAQAKSMPMVAIQAIDNRAAESGEGDCSFYHFWSTPGGAIREVLTDELVKTGAVTVLERQDLNNIYSDEFKHENLDESTKMKKKKFIAAKYAVSGVISEFEWCVSGAKQGVDIGGLLGIGELNVGHSTSKAHVAMDLRLIDVETGKILKTFKTDGQVDDGGFKVDVGIKGVSYSRNSFGKTPLGKANQIAMSKAAREIADAIQELN